MCIKFGHLCLYASLLSTPTPMIVNYVKTKSIVICT